ncbi:MAG: YbhB/YbcL family Raf kinase inhibitor-like protein [Gammaproteobacteria bacterium]|nr:YbhB/YbcL family Raf kinase inhibitor-like protein [Gammaproteobacteria bacterium]
MRGLKVLLAIGMMHLSMAASAENVMQLKSGAAADHGALPVAYTCDGKNISPALLWSGKPKNTQSFALIVSDPDAPSGTFYHWVLFNIPANVTELAEGISALPGDTVAGKNSWEKMAYNGPCPPKGASHRYVFTLYALDKKLDLMKGADALALIDAMTSHVLQEAEYTMVYSRWGS